MALSHIRVVGSGLIGTSIGLAARKAGLVVDMVDSNPRAQAIARDLVASPESTSNVDLVIFALPISALPGVLEEEFKFNINSNFMDISSVKVKPLLDIKASKIPSARFLPTHPMAGREIGGAESARGDLFIDRPWIIDPAGVEPATLELARELISLCGATIFELPVAEHDKAVALISHLPQITSSLLAAQLASADRHWLELAGGGLRDTTRIAASDASLWREIISSNAEALKPLLLSMRNALDDLIQSIGNADKVEEFIKEGNKGRAAIPGKHGGAQRNYTQLPVIIDDKPGQLAAIFDECDNAHVNVEDISIEHSPGQETGLVLLSLSESDARTLEEHLQSKGWSVHSPRSDKP